MRPSAAYYGALLASLPTAILALNGIVVPPTIQAESQFKATFLDSNSDKYRVFLAAAPAGVNGPTCYLTNSTSLSSPIDLTIPASVGPSADYYSIAISDLTTSQASTYSNTFNFTGGTGVPTEYEQHLDGAPFWNANDLPCSAYECARKCAMASYPADLTEGSAENTMKTCILKCPGVTPAADETEAAQASSSSSAQTVTATPSGASSSGSATGTSGGAAAATSSGAASKEQIGLAAFAGVAGVFMLS